MPPDGPLLTLQSLARPSFDGGEAFQTFPVSLDLTPDVLPVPKFSEQITANVKEARLLSHTPWVRPLGKLDMTVQTDGWKFPTPAVEYTTTAKEPRELPAGRQVVQLKKDDDKPRVRPRPTADHVLFKDRLLYLLQPPLDGLFDGRQLEVPFEPFPYQLEGIAFLMPRHAALLADEMGLGKTAQTILAIRLMFHQGMLNKALVVAPKPLIHNWCRELKLWAPDVPHEVIGGSGEDRRRSWIVSNCPLKIINYETLTRDYEILAEPGVAFDLVVLDEAQRIKNRGSKTAQIVCSIKRSRSWAMSGTPVENHPDDLVNLFSFIDPGRLPPDCPANQIPTLTSGLILRRTKDDVQSDMPPKMIKDLEVDLTPAQREAYDRAENEGVIRLNELGDTITVQHVFQLVMRLKQICNFDPLTGESAKLEQLVHDMEEVAENGRKAIVFSQWVEPLEVIAEALKPFGPLQYHGRIPQQDRTPILDRFKADPDAHVILMSYGTGSVGLNLQFTNYVFLFDRWWNPAVEDQAINRAHRVGQRHPVTVTRFLTENTIEKRIAGVLEAKRKIFNDLLGQADKPSSLGLTEDEIFGLFDIRSRPKRST